LLSFDSCSEILCNELYTILRIYMEILSKPALAIALHSFIFKFNVALIQKNRYVHT